MAVSINLAIIFGTRLTISNVIELLIPYMKSYIKSQDGHNNGSHQVESRLLTKAEIQFSMPAYDRIQGSLDDYAELIMQFGYMTFFIAALPIASCAAFLSNYVEIRTDAYKMLKSHQRPIPCGAEDIGTWKSILSLMCTISVVTNAGLICFTMNILDPYNTSTRFWIFIGFQWFCFTAQNVIQYVVPDDPFEVQVQIARGKFIVDKLVRKVPDEVEERDNNESEKFVSNIIRNYNDQDNFTLSK